MNAKQPVSMTPAQGRAYREETSVMVKKFVRGGTGRTAKLAKEYGSVEATIRAWAQGRWPPLSKCEAIRAAIARVA